MNVLSLFTGLIAWIFRGVVIKFTILSAVFAVLAIVVPLVIQYISPLIGVSSLSSAFAGIDSGVWWFIDYSALDYGIPLLISAAVARFLIRRLPLIG